MVLRLKARKSRSPPGPLNRPTKPTPYHPPANRALPRQSPGPTHTHLSHGGHIAGWSSPVARQAHNLKVIGSNPIPATTVACSPSRYSVEMARRRRGEPDNAPVKPDIRYPEPTDPVFPGNHIKLFNGVLDPQTIKSRPCGVRRAFLWMFIRGSGSGLVGFATPASHPRPRMDNLHGFHS